MIANADIAEAIADQLQVGLGQGPVHHFYALWSQNRLAAENGLSSGA